MYTDCTPARVKAAEMLSYGRDMIPRELKCLSYASDFAASQLIYIAQTWLAHHREASRQQKHKKFTKYGTALRLLDFVTADLLKNVKYRLPYGQNVKMNKCHCQNINGWNVKNANESSFHTKSTCFVLNDISAIRHFSIWHSVYKSSTYRCCARFWFHLRQDRILSEDFLWLSASQTLTSCERRSGFFFSFNRVVVCLFVCSANFIK